MITTDRVGLILPDPWECPQMIAEAVYDVWYRRDTEVTHKILQNKYGTVEFLMDAVEVVFLVNEWTYTTAARAMFRKIFRAKPVGAHIWVGNAKMERHAAANKQPTKWNKKI